MKIRLASDISVDSVVDGPGLRTVIWCQGCYHNCSGCHNPNTHDINGGFEVETTDLINKILGTELQTGVTFSGGDPMLQAQSCAYIASVLKEHNINIWCYTGFLYEELLDNPTTRHFLEYIDVLIDGKFIESLSSYELVFKGSSNQRIIDVQLSLQKNTVMEWGNERV